MLNFINYISGSVEVEVRGAYPERFFNLCSRNGIVFWNMTTVEIGLFQICMSLSDFRRIRSIAKKSMCKVHILKKYGFPFFAYKFRKRKMLVAGLIVFCVAAWIATNFVWIIDVEGFEELDTGRLMTVLEDAGLKKGAYTGTIKLSKLQNDVLIKMPELSYVTVNFSGSNAHVVAKKRTMPPKLLSSKVPCDIVADKDGIIYDITVKNGTAQVSRGETVLKGQLLASGYMTGRAGTTIVTHADADIRARTWQKLSAKTLKKQSEKVYTNSEKRNYTIIFFGNRIKLYPNSGISYSKCDKIISKTDLELPGGIKLPISIESATCREYETKSVANEESAKALLREGLHSALEISEDAEVVNTEFKTSEDDKLVYGSITVECIEKIGIKRELLRNG